jgi:hypothetical protein
MRRLQQFERQTRSLAERAQCAAAHQDVAGCHTLTERGRRVRVRAEETLDLVDLFAFNERTRWGRR